MLNKEYYAKEIIEIVTDASAVSLAVYKKNGLPCSCIDIECCECVFDNYDGSCSEAISEWANKEHVENNDITPY